MTNITLTKEGRMADKEKIPVFSVAPETLKLRERILKYVDKFHGNNINHFFRTKVFPVVENILKKEGF